MIDLANQEVFAALKDEIEDTILADDGQRAFFLARGLNYLFQEEPNINLENKNAAKFKEYQIFLDKLNFVAIMRLPEEEVIDLLKSKIKIGLALDGLNLVEKIKGTLIGIPDFSRRDDWRAMLREVLSANQEKIGSANIDIGGTMGLPIVANWLKKFDKKLGVSLVEDLVLNQFLSSDPDILKLREADEKAVRKLLEIHQYLKLSSQTPEGLEDPVIFNFDGKRQKLAGGQFEDVKLEGRTQALVDEIFKVYDAKEGITAAETPAAVTSDLNLNQALALASQIFTATKGDSQAVFNDLDSSLNNSDNDRVLGNLILIAQLRILDDLLADERFMSLARDDLKKDGQGDKVDELRLSPGAPHFVARFLKVVLQDKLGLSAADSLDFGRRIARILAMEGEKYSNIVNQTQDGEWRWNL